MIFLGIKCTTRKKKTKYEKYILKVIVENLLKRGFNTCEPNEKQAMYVIGFKIVRSKKNLYLSANIDLYCSNIIGYMISEGNDINLVIKTFEKAMINYLGATHSHCTLSMCAID